jgi:hypothetical protein
MSPYICVDMVPMVYHCVNVNVSAGMFLFLHVVDYLCWTKEQLQLFEVALEFSRDIRGKFWCGTMSSGWHSRWCSHDDG